MRRFSIGTWSHDWDRIDIDNWRGPKQSDAFRALARESDDLVKAKDQMTKDGKMTPEGIRLDLRDGRVKEKSLRVLAQAREAADFADNELAAAKAGMHARLREEGAKEAQLRAELRTVLREANPGSRAEMAFNREFAHAIIEQPAAASSLSPTIHAEVEKRFLDERFPGALDAANQIAESGNLLRQAANGLESYLRNEGLVKVLPGGKVVAE